MEIIQKTIRLEEALENSSIMEDAPEVLQGIYYGISEIFYAGKCNCHSNCKSGSHSKSRSSAVSYNPKNQEE